MKKHIRLPVSKLAELFKIDKRKLYRFVQEKDHELTKATDGKTTIRTYDIQEIAYAYFPIAPDFLFGEETQYEVVCALTKAGFIDMDKPNMPPIEYRGHEFNAVFTPNNCWASWAQLCYITEGYFSSKSLQDLVGCLRVSTIMSGSYISLTDFFVAIGVEVEPPSKHMDEPNVINYYRFALLGTPPSDQALTRSVIDQFAIFHASLNRLGLLNLAATMDLTLQNYLAQLNLGNSDGN